ncbi:hypothetical protein DLAC_01557 [Tieghemostelium lacteum]|uniref:S-adenosyl-L-methionine-dependent methyltransferase n=1 Tax=Tieghemostelium lacteum TaxID=361077 RepID=A0A152A5Q7_TIELA|nr:hypothetical protein DLAC_01557 [Tieghemostelium lacteum]|eukprot:KYR01563.1 hypothetical protein DLAC_01557 [Tieghemostelium lacteum]
MEEKSKVNTGVARTGIIVSACRALLNSKFLEMVRDKKITVENFEIRNHVQRVLENGVDLHDTVLNRCYYLDESQVNVYDPYADFFVDTPDSKGIILHISKALQPVPEKVNDFLEYIENEPNIVTWSQVMSRSMNLKLAFRTKYIDDMVIKDSKTFEQIVILASGLDCRSRRLPIPKSCKVFELDFPEVIDFKLKILSIADQSIERISQCPITMIGGNLTRDGWMHDLKDKGFDCTKPTLWMLEGFIMYLPPTEIDPLFEKIDSLSSSGSKVMVHTITGSELETCIKNGGSPSSSPKLMGIQNMEWFYIANELISRHENPVKDILEKHHFSKDCTSVTDKEIAKLYKFPKPDILKTFISRYSIGYKE